MKDLYLLNFNNYYNRQIKRLEYVSDYEPFMVGDSLTNVNFIPNDGIRAEQIINANYDMLGTPDYLVVADVGSERVSSRWFVIESKRLRNGQYRLSLKRDTIADKLKEVLTADSFIAKGTVSEDDPLIFNKEGLSFNQIKKSEEFLKDYTNIPWIVAYISPDVAKDAGNITGNIEGYYDVEYDKLESYPYFNYTKTTNFYDGSLVVVAPVVDNTWYGESTDVVYTLGLNTFSPVYKIPWYKTGVRSKTGPGYESPKDLWKKTSNVDRGKIRDLVSNRIDYDIYAALLGEVGKKIKIKDKIYIVDIIEKEEYAVEEITIGSAQDRTIQKCFKSYYGTSTPLYDDQKFLIGGLKIYGKSYKLVLKEEPYSSGSFTFNFTGVNLGNEDTPYGILCMPYSDIIGVEDKDSGTAETPVISKGARLKIMQALGSFNGEKQLLYDIQLLPYCPIRNLIISNNIIKTKNQPYKSVRVTRGEGSGYITSILVAEKSTFSFVIQKPIKVDNIKEANETDLWRLCSPNYAGVFEFNAAKFYNGSTQTIDRFLVDCSFKPYTPYIHVAPSFSGLYGKNFFDSRGLICGGDFSIDMISDAWASYQYNNKNFEKQFNRQIESMELNKTWDMWSAGVNGVGGAITGGIMGGLAGGPIGIAAGATAGIIDAGFNTAEAYYKSTDAINAAKDQHKWALGNIQAQPYGLTKVSALNNNNKIFPFIEYYTCTDTEKKAFHNKLKYEGMTVNVVGKIADYVKGKNCFIKANVLRVEDLKEDSHFLQDINNELATGVYLND